jgi:hypothetical protein
MSGKLENTIDHLAAGNYPNFAEVNGIVTYIRDDTVIIFDQSTYVYPCALLVPTFYRPSYKAVWALFQLVLIQSHLWIYPCFQL